MKKCKKQMKEKGITLIALVVTIIVLLILAGITIQIVLQGGVIKQANSAKTLTQIVEIEDVANIIYADLSIQKAQGKIDKISMNDIVSELNKQKYKIETREIGSNNVIGIKANPQKVNIIENGIATIKVNFDISEEKYLYYAVIEGKYYLMKLTNTGVVIERELKEPDGTVVEQNIEIETGYDTQIVKEIVINENEITLTGGKGEGSTTLVIKYGEYKTSCIVETAPKVTKITAKAITLKEGENEKIEVTLEPEGAVANLTYSTIDINKITVNDEGTVTAISVANGRMTDTAIVKIKDERTGISTNCSVTIESLVGIFIEYDVSYTDIDEGYEFSKENGWRLLNYTRNSDGTYSNVELISTGKPARLDYTIRNEENNEWYVTDTTKLNSFKNNVLRKWLYTIYRK
ncbi:MAG: hypothetical protein HFJ28_04190 [Clostridia bacterium]|nr:hypothetical protein [Clostridia bacterium]